LRSLVAPFQFAAGMAFAGFALHAALIIAVDTLGPLGLY
jgi:hypothetical protein